MQIVGVAHDMYFSDPREPFGALIFQPKGQDLPIHTILDYTHTKRSDAANAGHPVGGAWK